jgi:hypothetical protein
MPIIGWFYARVIQREAPIAFMALMGGHCSPYFIFKMMLIGVLLTVGGTYVVKRNGSKAIVWGTTAGLVVVLAVIMRHPPLDWMGSSAAVWRLGSSAIVLALIGWLWLCRAKGDPQRNAWQWAMFVVGLCAFFTFAMGGFVRERSKSPDTVYGEIVKPEWTDSEADRYLVYEKWLKPREELPVDLERSRPESWRQEVEQAQAGGLVLTDNEAERIINYLEANH